MLELCGIEMMESMGITSLAGYSNILSAENIMHSLNEKQILEYNTAMYDDVGHWLCLINASIILAVAVK